MPIASHIHGHEIILLVAGAKRALTHKDLHDEVARRFGAGARFCTCSADGMTLDQLLAFLAERGKVVEQNGRMVADVGRMCRDGEAHEH